MRAGRARRRERAGGADRLRQRQIEHAPLARAITRQAYAAGARYVDVSYRDQHVRKAMIELGPDDALTYEPGWLKTLAESNADQALIATTGDPEPDLLSDLDAERVGQARMKGIAEIYRQQLVDRSSNGSGCIEENCLRYFSVMLLASFSTAFWDMDIRVAISL